MTSTEQRARELAAKLAEEGGIDVLVPGQMGGILAAALAACAREEAKWWLEKAGRDGHFWIVSPIHKHPEDCRCEAHERLRVLERAAGRA